MCGEFSGISSQKVQVDEWQQDADLIYSDSGKILT